MGVSLFNFTDRKRQWIRWFFMSHPVVPTAGDAAAALERYGRWQRGLAAADLCHTWVPKALWPQCPAPAGCPWSAPWPLSDPAAGFWVLLVTPCGRSRRVPLPELLQNPVTVPGGCWRVTGRRTICACARKDTLRKDSVHAFGSIMWEWKNSSAPWNVCRVGKSMQTRCLLNVTDWDQ